MAELVAPAPGGGLVRVPGPPSAPAQRVRVDVAYDGTAFAGWAVQPGQRTVQAELERALGVLARADPPPRTVVAGRTDAGVHARGQVVHVDLPLHVAQDLLLVRRLNGLLDHDVRVRAAALAPDGFSARYSALSRTYRYRVTDDASAVDPLRRHDTLWWPRPLDAELLRQASTGLVGLNDFAAFCKRRARGTTRRTLLRLDWDRQPDGVLVATVQADAFCHSMVRSLVGGLLAVGEGRRPPAWPAELLALTARPIDLDVAPARGLTLERVDYPSDDQLLARQAVTRATRSGAGD